MAKDNVFDDPGFGNGSNAFDDPNLGKPSSLARRAGDLGLGLAKGVIGVPETLVGLADIPTLGRTGKALESAGVRFKDAKDYLDTFQSPEQKAANEAVGSAKGFVPTLAAAVKNPSFIAQQVAEQAPQLLAGGAVSRGLAVAPKLGAVARGAIGEGIITAGQNVEQVREEEPTGVLTPKQVALNSLAGGITGGIAYGGGRVANKLGLADVETMLAGGPGSRVVTAEGKTPPGLAKRVAGGLVTEGALQETPQSYQEQVFQNLSQNKPWDEGAAEAAAQGGIVGGVMGAGANIIPPKPAPGPLEKPPEQPETKLLPRPGDVSIVPGSPDNAAREAAVQAADDAAKRTDEARAAEEARLAGLPALRKQAAIDAVQELRDKVAAQGGKVNKPAANRLDKLVGAARDLGATDAELGITGLPSPTTPLGNIVMGATDEAKVAAADAARKADVGVTPPIDAAIHAPDAGPLSRAAAISVDNGLSNVMGIQAQAEADAPELERQQKEALKAQDDAAKQAEKDAADAQKAVETQAADAEAARAQAEKDNATRQASADKGLDTRIAALGKEAGALAETAAAAAKPGKDGKTPEPKATPLQTALTTAAAPHWDVSAATAAIKTATKENRPDIAAAIVERAHREATQAEAALPSVAPDSPQYEPIAKALQDKATAARADAERLSKVAGLVDAVPKQAPTGEQSGTAPKLNAFGLPVGVRFGGDETVPVSSVTAGDWLVLDGKAVHVQAVAPGASGKVSLTINSPGAGVTTADVSPETRVTRKAVQKAPETPAVTAKPAVQIAPAPVASAAQVQPPATPEKRRNSRPKPPTPSSASPTSRRRPSPAAAAARGADPAQGLGVTRDLSPVVDRAKAIMRGEREASAMDVAWFKGQAKSRRGDAPTSKLVEAMGQAVADLRRRCQGAYRRKSAGNGTRSGRPGCGSLPR
jgi:hypothetical protein